MEQALHKERRITDLPLEMLELILIRAFLVIYPCDVEDDVELCVKHAKSLDSERQAFSLLSSVCSVWNLALTGWPQSPTRRWVRHRLRKQIERSCHPFQRSAQLRYHYDVCVWQEKGDRLNVRGVSQLSDVIYVVCERSSTISRFSITTHQRLADISVAGLKDGVDIIACELTSRLYVADIAFGSRCVWRVSPDGANVRRWWSPFTSPGRVKPRTLSVRAGRLLITSYFTIDLFLLDIDGDELCRITLPRYMIPFHAVETPTAALVGHYNTELKQSRVSEVNLTGDVLRHFSGSHQSFLCDIEHIAVDSRGYAFVAHSSYRGVLLLDSDLMLHRVVIGPRQLNHDRPLRLCYREHAGQLLVGFNGFFGSGVKVFDVLHH